MRQGFFTALLALAVTAGLTVGAAAACYTDVAVGAWYYDAVTEVTQDGLMNGTSETAFSPETPVTRGMAAAVLWRLAGSPDPADRNFFSDVEGWYYYADAAAWCAQHGITKANYYYRLKRVRKACLDQYQNNCRQTWCWVLCSAPSFLSRSLA